MSNKDMKATFTFY